ncbi:50S ribosomal protein L11 methyltransferase [Brevibacillus fulvus]|uniref:Ribosomal protein L11 methyltransferase n=1 Tax=Brevibacillus fulvus TaxID=1125967 RepID=A0A938XYM3_9BACL|nr:50S ribosomal protein L11 methyltransferase [Brevibacillus fulvus]MBM7590090.1 ribosomal protein L11 methyltransferase [Brevibacillus fulvus]
MERNWLKYTLFLEAEVEEEFTLTIMESPYTLGWTEPQIEVIRTDNGYDYQTVEEAPVIAYLFEPLTADRQTHIEQLNGYLSRWNDRVRLGAAEEVAEELDSWKEDYQEIEVGDWTIAPTWTPAERLAGKDKVLRIDPGAAFGTGYHGTTQDILYFLQKLELRQRKVLDIGTGSGILGIYSVLAGAALPVCGVDINPESAAQVKHNLEQNGLPDSSIDVIIGDPLEDAAVAKRLPDQVDFVYLNIGGYEDIKMLPVVKERIVPGGMLLLSGMVEWNRHQVEEAYRQAGFRIIDERQSQEWVTLLVQAAWGQ